MTSSLILKKTWQLTNLLNDDNRQQKKTTLLIDNKCMTGKAIYNDLRKGQHYNTVTGENKRYSLWRLIGRRELILSLIFLMLRAQLLA